MHILLDHIVPIVLAFLSLYMFISNEITQFSHCQPGSRDGLGLCLCKLALRDRLRFLKHSNHLASGESMQTIVDKGLDARAISEARFL